jgi:hypothetical protein
MGVPFMQAFMPSGPMVNVVESVFGRDFFRAKDIHGPTDSATEKVNASIHHMWKSMMPNFFVVPGSADFGKAMDTLIDGKMTILGNEPSKAIALAALLGFRLSEQPLAEAQAFQSSAIRGLLSDTRAAVGKQVRDQYARGNPDPVALQEFIAEQYDRLHEKIKEKQQ